MVASSYSKSLSYDDASYLHQFMLDFGCGKVTRIIFCLAGNSTSISWGQLTNGRGMSTVTRSTVKLSITDNLVA
jgi:hypothetical protein